MIKKVAVIGGTHGNEFTGVYLLKKWQKQPQLIQRENFSTSTLFANPRAYEHNHRYIDCDLNRQFKQVDLDNNNLSNYEQSRAKVINQQLGPKGDAKTDFAIDLHTTTANMGPCLILPHKGKMFRQLAAYTKANMPEAIVFLDDQDLHPSQHYFLSTVATNSVLVEVGPVPQSVLRQDVYEQSEQLTHIILDFIELYNNDELPELTPTFPAYRFDKSIKLPLDENGERTAMVHANIQDGDFKALNPGDPLFRTFDGEDILFDGPDTVYPAFINEAAYYDNDLAMSLLTKVEVEV